MANKKLKKVSVFLPGNPSSGLLDSAKQTKDLSKVASSEVKSAIEKCNSITHIDGEEALVTELHMKGITCIKDYEIAYDANGETNTRKLSRKEFYDL